MALKDIKLKTNTENEKPIEEESNIEKIALIFSKHDKNDIVLKQIASSNDDPEIRCYAIIGLMNNNNIESNNDAVEEFLHDELGFDSQTAKDYATMVYLEMRNISLENYIAHGSTLDLKKTVYDKNEDLDFRCDCLYKLLQLGDTTYSSKDIVKYLRISFGFNEFDSMMIMNSLDKYIKRENLDPGNIHI